MIAFKLLGNENFMEDLLRANMELSEIVIFPAGVEVAIPFIEKNRREGVAPWLQKI